MFAIRKFSISKKRLKDVHRIQNLSKKENKFDFFQQNKNKKNLPKIASIILHHTQLHLHFFLCKTPGRRKLESLTGEAQPAIK